MGAYLNNGNGWTSIPQLTPPNTLAAYGYTDLGVRFVDLNGDGKTDMVYNRQVPGEPSRKGAYFSRNYFGAEMFRFISTESGTQLDTC